MVAKGFSGVDKRFDGVDKRLDGVDKRLDGVDKSLNKLAEDAKDVRRDILNLGDRFVSYHTFDALARRVKTLEEKR